MIDERAAAEGQAKAIREFWKQRGHKVKSKAVPARAFLPGVREPETIQKVEFWTVESDMIDGLPRAMKEG